MDQKEPDFQGLTTEEALTKLCHEIETTVVQYKSSHNLKYLKSWLYRSLHHTSHYTNINWISVVLIIACVTILVFCDFIGVNSLACKAICIVVFSVCSVSVELLDNRYRQYEIARKILLFVKELREQIVKIKWSHRNYPQLTMPYSPCLTLQWTFRDSRIVNLPWALLVKDDVIIMRPGQQSPGYCEAVDKSNEIHLLHAREVFGPCHHTANEIFSVPKARKPLENRRYKLLETPYLANLKLALELGADRPVTPHTKQRHLLMVKVMQQIMLPMFVCLIYAVNCIRYFYLEESFGEISLVELFLLMPVCVAMPLLPIVFPIVWNCLNYLGVAKFKASVDCTENDKSFLESTVTDEDVRNEVMFESLDYKTIWTNFKDIVLGRACLLPRTANILHILGSVTALCCVDKKGILSWPNPTAEKVFFLHNSDTVSDTSSLANLNELHQDGCDSGNCKEDSGAVNEFDEGGSSVVEVLDVTYDQKDPFKLHFDDIKWRKHMSSLKPLGLAILLNTCNLNTQDHYTQFCAHVTCEAMYNENLVPVANRRCLCELAKEIGFLEQAPKIFSLEHQLSTFRHLQPEMVRRDNKYARSLSMSTKLKFPFPHMFAVVVKELSSGSMQLLSQGTADIVLDSCVDYWDGHDLCPLTSGDRKKIQDFYQRTSLTAYCTAFAYRPLSWAISDKMSTVYLELPSDSRHLYQCHRSPTPAHWADCRSVLEPKIRTPLGPFYSTDSLLYNDLPNYEVSDADSCFDVQCNQVLIGLVTMQYQAQTDMVHLIEQLERACIRFVHFSKENELRSRVFSEKMGLESGWNCHISLLSDRNRWGGRDARAPSYWWSGSRHELRRKSQSDRRLYEHSTDEPDAKNNCLHYSNLESSRTMSFSAPSAINIQPSALKFDNESILKEATEDDGLLEEVGADESKDYHDWQSLSCLTDSTEHSVPVNFDMSNRAKLPRGIDKIRPHIELIDNVPLLVSLFTDCTPASTKEMLHIMQDYGEVVCAMGSSANNENCGIFLQADASIAIEPIYPQVCQKMEPFTKTDADLPSPIDISRKLNSLPCSLSFRRESPISIYHLVREARHYMWNLWNTVQFWLSCSLTISCLQLSAALLMLPSILTPGQVIWIVVVLVPILSISLMGTKTDADIMKKPQEKNQIVFNAEVAIFVLWCYGSKFLPCICFTLLTYAATLGSHCYDYCEVSNCSCVLFYLPIRNENSTIAINGWKDLQHKDTLSYGQNLSVVVLLLHFIAISMGFVHREHNLWSRNPFRNIIWLTTCVFLVLIQACYSLANLVSLDAGPQYATAGILTLAFLSPFASLVICELVKKEEIKVNLRQQRRIRLDFGTKLGMNSPF